MKLLATDMDGTFLRDDKSYSEEFNDLYKQMLKQGIQFVIASGNQYEALACKFDEEIKNDLYYLCENGTKIVYRGKTLYKKALKKEDAKEILDILKQDQECMLVVSGDKHAYISKSFEDKKDFISLFMKNVQFVESYDDIEDDILKFSIASFDDQMEQRIEKIQKQLKPHLKLVTTGNVWFDIFYKDVNKGTTLTHLLEILKIKPEESGAFGDQMNDYEMLQTVKYGYAMANAMPPVKEVAYQVIDSNENDGVILKIKEILKPQCIIRFGATFPEKRNHEKDYQNLVYNLGSIDAFNNNLVKGVIAEYVPTDSNSNLRIKLISIKNKEKCTIQKIEKNTKKSYELAKNDSLSIVHEDFHGVEIIGITKYSIVLSNGIEITVGTELSPESYSISYQDMMIETALERHFEIEKENYNKRGEEFL